MRNLNYSFISLSLETAIAFMKETYMVPLFPSKRLMGCLLLAVSFEKKSKSMTTIVWSSNEAINIVVKLTIGQDEIEIIEQKFLHRVCVCKYTNATST